MKKILLMAAMLAALTACEHYEFTEETTNDKGEIVASKAFTFHLKGDFTTSFEEMTRAAVRLENDNTAGITDIWVLDYQDGKLLQQVHQVASDADFGHPQMNLAYGEHNIKFVASKGLNPTLTASALTWAKVLDTFVRAGLSIDGFGIEQRQSCTGAKACHRWREVSRYGCSKEWHAEGFGHNETQSFTRSSCPCTERSNSECQRIIHNLQPMGQDGTCAYYLYPLR